MHAVALWFALQPMKIKTGDVHIFGTYGGIKPVKQAVAIAYAVKRKAKK